MRDDAADRRDATAPKSVRLRGLVVLVVGGVVAAPAVLALSAHPPRWLLQPAVLVVAIPVVVCMIGLAELVTGRGFGRLARGFRRLHPVGKFAVTVLVLAALLALAVALFVRGLELAS